MTAMMITSALLMAAAVIFRKTLGKKLNGRLLMLMWAIVFIKLAVPVSIPSDFSVMNLFSGNSDNAEYFNISHSENKSVSDISRSENAADSNSEQNNSEISAKSINTFPAAEISPEAAGSPKQKIDLGKTAYSIYSVIAAVLAIFVLTAYIICSVRFSRFEDMKISEKYPGLRFKKSTLGTPAVFGIFRPIILIPEDTDITDSIALGHIILHEKTHIRHHDQLFNMLTLMICCLNWYDPLAWVCRTLYLKDTEKWCDETVINIIGSENRQSYAKTLLACAEDRSRPFMLISGFGESDIKTRIKAILEDKKLRRGASLTAVILIIIIAAVLGTGKSVKAEMTFSDFVPTLNGWDYTQKFSGNNGETAAVTLNLNNDYGEYKPPNYFHFTIGIDSEEYSISEPHAKMRMTGVKSFRVVPDGERNDNESSVTYNADFNKASNDIELAVTFDRSAEPTLTADISYKLKKGIFTVGNYSMRVFYNRDMIYGRNVKSGYAGNIASINNQLNDHGFLAEIKENGYEISSIDGSTDLTIYFDDFDDGAVISDDSGRELKLDIFNPYYSMIESVDVTNDGVNDLVITEHITGTGVIQNYWKIIDGKNLCEIPVDTEGIEHIIIDFVNSGVFADFAAGTVPTYSGFDFPEGTGEIGTNKDDIFSETDPHLTGNLFWDE